MRALLFLTVTTQKMAGDAIVSAVWRYVCGAIMARLLFGATQLENYKSNTKALSILVPSQQHIRVIWIFLYTSLKN